MSPPARHVRSTRERTSSGRALKSDSTKSEKLSASAQASLTGVVLPARHRSARSRHAVANHLRCARIPIGCTCRFPALGLFRRHLRLARRVFPRPARGRGRRCRLRRCKLDESCPRPRISRNPWLYADCSGNDAQFRAARLCHGRSCDRGLTFAHHDARAAAQPCTADFGDRGAWHVADYRYRRHSLVSRLEPSAAGALPGGT